MALICNVTQTAEPTGLGPQDCVDQWGVLYKRHDSHVESGSALFAQAFAEALGFVADLELHDLCRAELRLGAIRTLVVQALEQYNASRTLALETGLSDYHQERLREIGESAEGYRRTLLTAREEGLLAASEEQITAIATRLDERGYSDLLGHFIGQVATIRDLVTPSPVAYLPGASIDGIKWQETGWKLITAFTRATEIGHAIAMLNTFMFRNLSPEQS